MTVQLLFETNFDQVAARFGEAAVALPGAMSAALNETARAVGEAVQPALYAATPVKSGALQSSTTHQEQQIGPLEAEVWMMQPAANPRSGYLYARARAYGHIIANQYGTYGTWTPPEDPRYPIAAVDDARPEIESALAAGASAAISTAFHVGG